MKHKLTGPRQRILETASKLFHTRGFNSTGINQIIEEASVAKASLYQHFKSKEDLAVEYLNIRHTFWFDKLKSYTDKKVEPLQKVHAAFDFIMYMNKKENYRGCSFLNMLSEIRSDNLKILGVIQNHKTDLRNFFGELIKNKAIADHIYLLFEGSIIESQLYKDNWSVKQSQTIINTLIQ